MRFGNTSKMSNTNEIGGMLKSKECMDDSGNDVFLANTYDNR